VKATCPKNKKHKKFVTVAHVMEDWIVDENGEWIETKGQVQTSFGPNPDNIWTCAECGATAKVS